MPSRAHNFFQQIIADDDKAFQFLTDLPKKRQREAEFIEFKSGRIADVQAKCCWSELLSGFANTEGGVLIFGVLAKPVEITEGGVTSKIDAAYDVDLVPNVDFLEQSLRDWQLHATQDPVQGVDIRKFRSGAGVPEGFVVCYIPEGNNKPYRAPLGDKLYCMRVGANTVLIPHTLLRSLFFPQIRVNLACTVDATCIASNRMRAVSFKVLLRNDGPATAQDMVVKAYSSQGSLTNRSGSYSMWDPRNEPSPFSPGVFGAIFQAKLPLHPQDTAAQFEFVWETRQRLTQPEEMIRFDYIRLDTPFLISIVVHIKDQAAAYFLLILTQVVNNNDHYAPKVVDFDEWKRTTAQALAIAP